MAWMFVSNGLMFMAPLPRVPKAFLDVLFWIENAAYGANSVSACNQRIAEGVRINARSRTAEMNGRRSAPQIDRAHPVPEDGHYSGIKSTPTRRCQPAPHLVDELPN